MSTQPFLIEQTSETVEVEVKRTTLTLSAPTLGELSSLLTYATAAGADKSTPILATESGGLLVSFVADRTVREAMGQQLAKPAQPVLPLIGWNDNRISMGSDTLLCGSTILGGPLSTDTTAVSHINHNTIGAAAPQEAQAEAQAEEALADPFFPTTPDSEGLPEVSIQNAHRLLLQPSGTYFLHFPAKEMEHGERTKLQTRIHTAKYSWLRRNPTWDCLVETVTDPEASTLAVTIVKGAASLESPEAPTETLDAPAV